MTRAILAGLLLLAMTSASAVADVCGDGVREGAEECDDGNVDAGDCCSPTCTAVPAGTPCADDGFVCTIDACDGAGVCAHDATPPPGCHTGTQGKGRIAILGGADPRIAWKWRGTIPDVLPFGAPVVSNDVTFCLADAGHALRLEATAPKGGLCDVENCWYSLNGGFQYIDRLRTPDGIERLKLLKKLTLDRSRIDLKGRGANLALAPLPYMPPITAWILPEGVDNCWVTEFVTTRRNDGVQLKANSD